MVDVFMLSQLRQAEQGNGLLVRCGGSAANTAAWLSHLGVATCFVGCVGSDAAGEMLTRSLAAAGVQARIRRVPGAETGAVAVEIDEQGERVMRSSRGANQSLAPQDISALTATKLRTIHLTGYSFLGPHGLNLLAAARHVADLMGALISLDPSSLGVINRFGRAPLVAEMQRQRVDILLPNSDEAQALVGITDPGEAAHRLGGQFACVAVKLGSEGALIVEDQSARFVPTSRLDAVDTTGAGDAFNAGFLGGLHGRIGSVAACQQGHRIASEVILRYGGSPPS